MKKKAAKRHQWKYPNNFSLSPKRPATCACGARMYYVEREKKSETRYGYGSETNDTVIEIAGHCLVNPSPVPGCTRT